MGRGRKPKTVAQRIFEGGTGKGPMDIADVVHPDEAPPSPPDWLDVEARAEWDRVIVNLLDKDLVGRGDASVLANYCMAVSTCVACYKDIAAHGYTATHPNGAEYRRPILNVLTDARSHVIRFAGELGLTVVARTRLGSGRTRSKRKSELQAFIDKGLKIG